MMLMTIKMTRMIVMLMRITRPIQLPMTAMMLQRRCGDVWTGTVMDCYEESKWDKETATRKTFGTYAGYIMFKKLRVDERWAPQREGGRQERQGDQEERRTGTQT